MAIAVQVHDNDPQALAELIAATIHDVVMDREPNVAHLSALVANEERIIDLITLTAEPGVIGGIPASGIDFGAAINTQAVIDQQIGRAS